MNQIATAGHREMPPRQSTVGDVLLEVVVEALQSRRVESGGAGIGRGHEQSHDRTV